MRRIGEGAGTERVERRSVGDGRSAWQHEDIRCVRIEAARKVGARRFQI